MTLHENQQAMRKPFDSPQMCEMDLKEMTLHKNQQAIEKSFGSPQMCDMDLKEP